MIRISAQALEQLAAKRGMDLELEIRADGLKASLTMPVGPMDVPVELHLERISAARAIIEGEGLTVHASMLPIPMSLLTQFTGKYKFLALDTTHKRVFINLQSLVPEGISVSLESATLVECAIEFELELLEIKDMQNI